MLYYSYICGGVLYGITRTASHLSESGGPIHPGAHQQGYIQNENDMINE
jgi:hypothetical protein